MEIESIVVISIILLFVFLNYKSKIEYKLKHKDQELEYEKYIQYCKEHNITPPRDFNQFVKYNYRDKELTKISEEEVRFLKELEEDEEYNKDWSSDQYNY